MCIHTNWFIIQKKVDCLILKEHFYTLLQEKHIYKINKTVLALFLIMLLYFTYIYKANFVLVVLTTCLCLSIKCSTHGSQWLFVTLCMYITMLLVSYTYLTSLAKTCKIDGLLFHFKKWVRSLHIAIFFCMQFACVVWYCI